MGHLTKSRDTQNQVKIRDCPVQNGTSGHPTHKRSRLFVRSLLYCDGYCKSSVGLQTGHKRTYIAIDHDVTILGD